FVNALLVWTNRRGSSITRHRSKSGNDGRRNGKYDRYNRDSNRDKNRERDRNRDRDRDRDRDRNRNRDRERNTEKDRKRNRNAEGRDRERNRNKDRERGGDGNANRSAEVQGSEKTTKAELTTTDKDKNTDINVVITNGKSVNDNIGPMTMKPQTPPPISGPAMVVKVLFQKDDKTKDQQIIDVTVAKNARVSDFKTTLFHKNSINVFRKYQLLVDGKELGEAGDQLLCVHAGLKPVHDKHKIRAQIVLRPVTSKTGGNGTLPVDFINEQKNLIKRNGINELEHSTSISFSGQSNEKQSLLVVPTTTTTTTTTTMNCINIDNSLNNLDTITKEQVKMLQDYADVFGLDEAAAMWGLDYKKLKASGYDKVFEELTKGNIPQNVPINELTDGGSDVFHVQNVSVQDQMDALAATAASSSFVGFDPSMIPDPILAQQMASLFAANVTASMYGNLASESTYSNASMMGQPPPPGVLDSCSVFVGDLHPLVTKEDLYKIFSSTGTVLWVQLFDCHKELERPFNFAFVYFDNQRSAQNAIDKLNFTKFYGAPARLMWKQQQSSLTWTESNIIVKNLPPNTDSQMLHEIFSRYGKIISSKVKTTQEGRCLSYGYVQFETKESAGRAIAD
ncbi:polyadenylate-binding protein 1, partial [Reticulomyxa filosa]